MPHQCTTCGYVFEDGSKEMLSGCPECSGTTFQFHPADTDVSESHPDESASPSPPRSSLAPNGGRVGKHVGRATSTVRGWMSSGSSTTDESGVTEDATDEDSSAEEPNKLPVKASATDAPDSTDETTTDAIPDDEESNKEHSASRASIDENGHDADVLAKDGNHSTDGSEDTAQANARSEFVSRDKLPPHSSANSSSSSSAAASTPAADSTRQSPSPSNGRVVREPTGDQPDLEELRKELNDQFESIKILAPGQYELNLMELYNRDEYIIALRENGRYAIQMPESWRGGNDE